MGQILNVKSSQIHEFLRDTLNFSYIECVYCKKRSQFNCLKCNSCYSCHWKTESLEKIPKYFVLGD